MSIWNWLARLRKGRDEAARQRAEAGAVETPEERKYTSGDIEALQADESTAEHAGGSSFEGQHPGE